MIRHQIRTSNDTKSTKLSARIARYRSRQKDFKTCSKFDEEERATHVNSDDFSRFSSSACLRT